MQNWQLSKVKRTQLHEFPRSQMNAQDNLFLIWLVLFTTTAATSAWSERGPSLAGFKAPNDARTELATPGSPLTSKTAGWQARKELTLHKAED